MQKFAIVAALAAFAVPALEAQNMDTLRKHWKLSGEFTLDVAKTMPTELYTFKPNDEEMDFGRVHETELEALHACSYRMDDSYEL